MSSCIVKLASYIFDGTFVRLTNVLCRFIVESCALARTQSGMERRRERELCLMFNIWFLRLRQTI